MKRNNVALEIMRRNNNNNLKHLMLQNSNATLVFGSFLDKSKFYVIDQKIYIAQVNNKNLNFL